MWLWLISYYPHLLTVVFLVVYVLTKIPAKGLFFLRALLALVISIIFAHLNRWFYLWPAHLLFPSGHMTFCFGVSISLGLLRPGSLAITLPLLIPFGMGLVWARFHTVEDVLGAIPLVMVVYGTIHWLWRLPVASPPLDTAKDSP